MLDALSTWNWHLDGWIVAAAALCALSCALLGNFLVLRKMSMMGDAISHAVLPGLAVAWLGSQPRKSSGIFSRTTSSHRAGLPSPRKKRLT